MNFRVPQTAGNFLTNREIVSFSTKTLLHVVRLVGLYMQLQIHTAGTRDYNVEQILLDND